jgi:hypothetical protein
MFAYVRQSLLGDPEESGLHLGWQTLIAKRFFQADLETFGPEQRSASSALPSARDLAARRASTSRQTSVPSRKNTRSGTVSRLNPDKDPVDGRKK